MMDKTSGIWLLHSTPTFPYKRESNSFFPASGKTNGQTFICVTFPYDRFKDMYQVKSSSCIYITFSPHSLNWNVFLFSGEHLQYIKAPIFEHHIPNDFHQSLQDAANENRLNPNELKELSYQLKSIGGQVEFKRFVSRISEKEGEICAYLIHEEKTVTFPHFVSSLLHITSYIF